jgi:RNA polymerase sigma factor (sigma-70 family)
VSYSQSCFDVTTDTHPDITKRMNEPTSLESEQRRRFEAIFRMHYGDVLAYARRRTTSDEAADVVADTFLTAWRRIEDLPDEPFPWLLGVARRVLANQSRGDRRRDALLAKMLSYAPMATSATEAEDGDALIALTRLPKAEREAITLIAWEGLTPSQAAASLGCSTVALRVRLHRARRRLVRELDTDAPRLVNGPRIETDAQRETS